MGRDEGRVCSKDEKYNDNARREEGKMKGEYGGEGMYKKKMNRNQRKTV